MTAQLGNDGTFHFCATCPAASHCCQRIRTTDALEPPFILEREAVAIAAVTGDDLDDFIAPESTEGGLSVKAIDGKCFFYRRGSCSIYELRPLDCRLFPFDIIEEKPGQFVWIVYEDLCPVNFDYAKYFEGAKGAIAKSFYSAADLRKFADHGAEIMRKHRYRVLEEIAL